ncbi:MAG: hypothetical protein Q7T78_12110 [Rhodoferax sp.]|nr:hypothetical protein [Rhodoferax sp.]
MSWLKKLFGGTEQKQSSAPRPNEIQRLVFEQAENLMHVINESLQISNNSTNPSTKVSRLELASTKLDSLELLSAQHPFIKLQILDGVRKTISALSKEYSGAGYYAQTDSSCRDYRQDVWKNINMPLDDIAKGWRFGATMQLRTPLRVISRHGEVHEGLTDPPAIAQDQSEGYWLPLLKSFAEIGIDIPEVIMTNTTMASDVGQIPSDGGEYLKFLLKVRAIVEQDEPIESRELLLRDELRLPEWSGFCRKLGGMQAIQSRFFPAFIDVIKGLPAHSVAALWDAKLTTPKRISNAADAELRAIKGVGPAKLKAIREACAAAENPESEFVENVTR